MDQTGFCVHCQAPMTMNDIMNKYCNFGQYTSRSVVEMVDTELKYLQWFRALLNPNCGSNLFAMQRYVKTTMTAKTQQMVAGLALLKLPLIARKLHKRSYQLSSRQKASQLLGHTPGTVMNRFLKK